MSRGTRKPGFLDSLPFWSAYVLPPLLIYSAYTGGWAILLVPVFAWYVTSLVDRIIGQDRSGLDPEAPESDLIWYDLALWFWLPVQFVTCLWLLVIVTNAPHLSTVELVGLFFALGVLTGTVGINFAHEMMHRHDPLQRWMADGLLAMVFYNHFRSEHLVVHHTHVGTPRDTVTARYNEGFHRYFFRVLPQGLLSAWVAERARLSNKGLPWWDRANPFWRYAGLQTGFILVVLLFGGWAGLGLIFFQAIVAIWQLELTNYVEHYGLVRKKEPDGRFEPVRTHHSWNASHRMTNWLLINLQRHSDHHAKPMRPFPLLQPLDRDRAPELPFSYPLMTACAMIPPLWRRIMNPRVRKWRAMYYPEITNWQGPV